MGQKKIEQAIDELYDYVDSCKTKGFSGTQIVVQKSELLDKIDEMRLKVPDEISRCAKILERRDEILREAEIRAQKIIDDASVKAEAMVHDSEIMRQAYLQANEFISRANQQADETMSVAQYEANQVRGGAFEYTKDMLCQIESVLSQTLSETQKCAEAFIESLSRNLEIVTENRRELCEEIAPEVGLDSDLQAEIDGQTENNYPTDNDIFGDGENTDDYNINVENIIGDDEQ